jgi:hypothetical protein
MNKKKILIVSMSFHPLNTPRAFRTTELTKELGRQGHEVDILTKGRGFDYLRFGKNFSCNVMPTLYTKQYNPNIFLTKRNLLKRIMDRFLYQFFLYPDIEISWAIVSKLKKINKNYDLIISIAKPYAVHIGCAIALNRNKNLSKAWIADCGDPFTLCKSDVYKFPFYINWLEKWMFRRVNFITVPVTSAINAYYKEFVPKIRIISQGFNFSEIKLFEGTIHNPCPTFCYAGAFYQKTRDPKMMLDYLTTLDIEFKFVVYTATIGVLEPYINKLGSKLEIREPIQREVLLYELSKMDFLVNIDNVFKEQVPSKIIDYALTKRPILSIEPENPDYNNILRFLKGDYSKSFDIGDINDYDISVIAHKFLDLLN